jgi:hypothetical protein
MTPAVLRPSILDLIAEREAAAGATAEWLREQIAAPTNSLRPTTNWPTWRPPVRP